MFISACSDQESWTNNPSQPPPESTVFTEINPAKPDLSVTPAISQVNNLDKWVLWTGETKLRRANIWQRIVIPDLDGHQDDFNVEWLNNYFRRLTNSRKNGGFQLL
jgi:hypothetical protein